MHKQKLNEMFMRFFSISTGYIRNSPYILIYLASICSFFFFLLLFLGFLWSREPQLFSVENEYNKYTTKTNKEFITGITTSATVIHLAEVLLNKPGGFISNDIMPPGLFLDNISNWEIGVLIQIRDITRTLRKDFSRSQSQSKEDPDLAFAEPQFNFDARSWILPASESEYQRGINKLLSYTKRLAAQEENVHFYTRADNLARWLADVSTRLGSLSQRLSSCVKKPMLEYKGDKVKISYDSDTQVITPWLKIDDIFYEARGTAWALIHLLQAIRIDFHDILTKKNALASIDQIIMELLATQKTVFFPMILNGSGFGILANHSIAVSSYISRANIGIIELKRLLEQG